MRVLMVCTTFPRFSGTFLVNKFLGLVKRGWDVHVAPSRRADPSQWEYFPFLPSERELGGRYHPSDDFGAVVSKVQPDLVHFEFGNLAIRRIEQKAMHDFKAVVSFRGAENVFALPDPGVYEPIWAATEAVHVLGEHMWEQAVAAGCPPDKRRYAIPPGIDTHLFDPGDRVHTEVAGTPDRPLRVLSVGRIHWKKGYEYTLHAIRMLREAGIHIDYRIVGEGSKADSEQFVRYAIEDMELTDSVTLVGAQPSSGVRDAHLWADVMVHSAVAEGFGNSVIEGQAMGTPVVCTDAGGLPENVADGVSGFVVPRRSPEAIAERLEVLATTPSLRQDLGEGGRQRAVERFSLDAQLDGFERLYHEVLSMPSTPHPGAVDLLAAQLRRSEGAELELRRELEVLRERNTHLRIQLRRAQESDRLREDQVSLRQVQHEIGYREQIAAIVKLVERELPTDGVVLVVSKGDERLVALGDRGWHFPRTSDGSYAGHHFAEDSEAVAHLEELRTAGARYLLLPDVSMWWLDHYVGFREHLEANYEVFLKDDCCIVYDLRPGGILKTDPRSSSERTG